MQAMNSQYYMYDDVCELNLFLPSPVAVQIQAS